MSYDGDREIAEKWARVARLDLDSADGGFTFGLWTKGRSPSCIYTGDLRQMLSFLNGYLRGKTTPPKRKTKKR